MMDRRAFVLGFALLFGSGAALAECKDYTSEATIAGELQTIVGQACRQPDGSWKIMSARPVRGDHDRARAAVAAGEALPLEEVLRRVNRQHPGRMLDARLQPAQSGSGWQYELELLSPDNRIRTLLVDARSGQVIEVAE